MFLPIWLLLLGLCVLLFNTLWLIHLIPKVPRKVIPLDVVLLEIKEEIEESNNPQAYPDEKVRRGVIDGLIVAKTIVEIALTISTRGKRGVNYGR